MLIWITAQLATPYAMRVPPSNRWAVWIKDETFRKCKECIERLGRDIFSAFRDEIESIGYSDIKQSLIIWTKPGRELDTTLVGRLLRERGVKSYEIYH